MKLTPCAQRTSVLDEKILEITSLNTSFRAIPESIRDTVKILLERVNSFYSNKIEGNPTKPKELIELDSGKNKKGINEIRRHISVQNLLKDHAYSPADISSERFIKFLHESFYRDTPIEEQSYQKLQNKLFMSKGENTEQQTSKLVIISLLNQMKLMAICLNFLIYIG